MCKMFPNAKSICSQICENLSYKTVLSVIIFNLLFLAQKSYIIIIIWQFKSKKYI